MEFIEVVTEKVISPSHAFQTVTVVISVGRPSWRGRRRGRTDGTNRGSNEFGFALNSAGVDTCWQQRGDRSSQELLAESEVVQRRGHIKSIVSKPSQRSEIGSHDVYRKNIQKHQKQSALVTTTTNNRSPSGDDHVVVEITSPVAPSEVVQTALAAMAS